MARKKQETLVLFPELLEVTKKFTNGQFGELIRAAFSYRLHGELYSGDDIAVDVAFLTVKNQIDRYQEYCSTLANNAKGSKAEQNAAKPQQSTPPIQSVSNPYPVQSISNPKENDNTADKPPVSSGPFEKFWSAYPKKVGKKSAKKAFSRVKEPVETLLAAIERQKCSAQWSKDNGQYIPNPTTWLNQGRWEDELEGMPKGGYYQKKPPVPMGCGELGDAELEAIQQVLKGG